MMAEIYILNTRDCEEQILSLEDKISQKRKTLLSKIKNDKAYICSVASEVLLSYSLKISLPVSYKTDENSKPFIPSKPFFNISHSGSFVVCAVSNSPIGVDIEEINRMTAPVTRKILSESEFKNAQSVSGKELQRLLCEKWVRKEAYLKMLGVGLRKPMTSLTFEGDLLLEESAFSKLYDLNSHFLSVCSPYEVPVSLKYVSKDNLAKELL